MIKNITFTDKAKYDEMLRYKLCNIVFEITYFCNFRCEYCLVINKLTKKIDTFDTDKAVTVLDKMIRRSINSNVPILKIYMAGGEPTVHPQFDEIYTAFYNKLVQHIDDFDEITFCILTNFTKVPNIMKQFNSSIKTSVTIAIHPETKLKTLIPKIESFIVNKGNIGIQIIALYGANNETYNKSQIMKRDVLNKKFGDDVDAHLSPIINYWEVNEFSVKRPQINELKYCKPLNFVVDPNMNILDTCKKCAKVPDTDDDHFDPKARICDHYCYDDFTKEMNDKHYIFSDDKDRWYKDIIPTDA